MFPRLLVFRNSGRRLHFSSSSFADSCRAPHLSSAAVVDAAMLHSVTSNSDHEAVIAQRPIRRGKLDVACVHRHLGLKSSVPLDQGTVSGSKIKLSCVDSIDKDRHLKQQGPAPSKESDPEKERCLLSTSSSSVATNQTRDSDATNQLSEESSVQDDDCTSMLEEYSLPTSFGKKDICRPRKSNSTQNSSNYGSSGGKQWSKNYETRIAIEPFDICLCESNELLIRHSDTEDHMFLSSSVDMEFESLPELDQLSGGPRQGVLRPGMVLLKKYITHSEQVLLVKKCRELGLGPGGFYQPGYKGGAKLRLLMMCLGLDWDPQTRKYQKRRQIDRSRPPGIPHGFHQLVDRAMQDSYDLIRRDFKVCNAEEILPPLSPDICIANFYTENGRLGLHQDRDESAESLAKGLPVVSFSLGDSAEFLYGDQRDTSKAEQVVLESGDVLIFGGESRYVFHGVASIIPNSAPIELVQETGLRPGRLNLTFRQF